MHVSGLTCNYLLFYSCCMLIFLTEPALRGLYASTRQLAELEILDIGDFSFIYMARTNKFLSKQ